MEKGPKNPDRVLMICCLANRHADGRTDNAQFLCLVTQIDGKWALDLHFSLLLIPFSMLILPFLLGCFKYTSLRYGHLNTTSQSWKEKGVWPLLLHFLAIWSLEHHFRKLEGERSMVPSIGSRKRVSCGSVIEAKRKSTALQVPFLSTWVMTGKFSKNWFCRPNGLQKLAFFENLPDILHISSGQNL